MSMFIHGTKRTLFVALSLPLLLSACTTQSTAQPTSIPTTISEPAAPEPSGQLPQTDADVPRISLEEARAALESGEAVIVDVRSPDSFEESHIPGALSVPLGMIERELASVPLEKDEWIITYCT